MHCSNTYVTSGSDANHREQTIWLLPSSVYIGWPPDLTLTWELSLFALLPSHTVFRYERRPQYYPAPPFVFSFYSESHVSCRLKPRTSTLSAPILHVVSECRAQSEMPWHTQSFLLGCENRDPATVGEIAQLPAVDLRSEGAQDASAVVHSCMLAMLDCSRFIEQDSLFYCVAGILPLNGQKSEAGNILTTNFLESCRWFFIFYFFKGRSIDLKQS